MFETEILKLAFLYIILFSFQVGIIAAYYCYREPVFSDLLYWVPSVLNELKNKTSISKQT